PRAYPRAEAWTCRRHSPDSRFRSPHGYATQRLARPAKPARPRAAAAKYPRSGSCALLLGIVPTLAGRRHLGAHRPEFREEAEAERLDQIIDPGGASRSGLLADDARNGL